MIDLDNFKQINDSLGHQVGDKVLEEIATLLKETTRPGDYLCRYGGEEFSIALPRTSSGEAFTVSERLRESVATNQIKIPKGLTLSAGVAQYPDDGNELDEVVSEADACLYRAKADGRNRTIQSSVPT
jgi:diguanylate cyclase (GGDEF)-like protein